ncbi:unnamed protein product [Clonostachys chloroleuca]|uniref:Uncharacterized protein n=1 Tax=Clonostachys chloroleuca TaxID=1926264 RepID=A0AA35M054_9HYPO|nr:unnamed protein product [Clonostachys chloroleuca]
MARVRSEPSNRARKRKGNLKVWSDGDRLQLLAYLDWCAHYEVDFRATAIEHLRNVTGKDFSKRQIGDKLKREWSKEKKCPDFEDVYALGMAAFSPLNHQEEDAFQRTIARIKPPNSQSFTGCFGIDHAQVFESTVRTTHKISYFSRTPKRN